MVDVQCQSPSVQGVAFSLPIAGCLDPLLALLGVEDHGQALLQGDDLQRRFGLTQGQATIHHYRLGDECLDYVSFEGVDPVQQRHPGVANSLWFQHCLLYTSDAADE